MDLHNPTLQGPALCSPLRDRGLQGLDRGKGLQGHSPLPQLLRSPLPHVLSLLTKFYTPGTEISKKKMKIIRKKRRKKKKLKAKEQISVSAQMKFRI